jgi:ABC-2 type transport system permease protein
MNEAKSSALRSARILVPLTALALVLLGHFQTLDLRRQIQSSAELSKQLWENQPKRFPLDGLNSGVYTPLNLSPLVAFDPGQSVWLGNSLWVQVGRLARSQDQTGYDYFAAGRQQTLSAALFFQIVIPCMALWLCLVQKKSWTGALQDMLESIAPGLALGVLTAAALNYAVLGTEGAARLILLLAVYVLYLLAATSITWLCFRLVKDLTLATTIAVSFWIFNLVLARPLTTNTASSVYPTPNLEEVARRLDFELRNGYSGVEPRRDRERRFVTETLTEYRVKKIEDLPVNLSAVMLKKEEQHQRTVYARRLGEIREQFARQERLEQFASLIFPSVGIQIASNAVAATDFASERSQLAAVDGRWAAITDKVYEDVVRSSGTDGTKVPRGPEFWRQFPAIQAPLPSISVSLGNCLIPVAGLFVWGAAGLVRRKEVAE